MPSPLRAQQGSAAADAAALAQRSRGLRAMRAANFSEAIDAFQRSLAIVESPNTRLDLGRALREAGRLASALRELERARDTGRARLDSGQSHYAQTVRTATTEADELRPRVPLIAMRFSREPPAETHVVVGETRIPASAISEPVPVEPGTVQLRVEGPSVRATTASVTVQPGARAAVELDVHPVGFVTVTVNPAVRSLAVSLDGRAFDAHDVGRAVEVEPGTHRIRVTAPGFQPVEMERTLGTGERISLDVELRSTRSALSASSAGQHSTQGAQGQEAQRRAPPRAPLVPVGIATLIGGGLLAGGGLALWLVADGEFNALLRECPSNPCTDAQQISRADSGHIFETLGVVGMIAGGTVATAGLGLLLGGVLSRERPPVAVVLAPRSISLVGSF